MSRAPVELAIVKAQRDALAQVMTKVWENARAGYESDAGDVEDWMTEAGLAENSVATKANPALEIEVGDSIIQLTDLGRAALAGVKP